MSQEKRKQKVALGRLGWPLRRLEAATSMRRETGDDYLPQAGIAMSPPGSWAASLLSEAAALVTAGPLSAEVASRSRPANSVTTGLAATMAVPGSERRVSASACKMYREGIEADLRGSRNAMATWQEPGRSAWVRRSLSERQEVPGPPVRVFVAKNVINETPQSERYGKLRAIVRVGCSGRSSPGMVDLFTLPRF